MKKRLSALMVFVLCVSVFGIMGTSAAFADEQDDYTQVVTYDELYDDYDGWTIGHYTCSKIQYPYSYFEQDFGGIDVEYLLEDYVELQSGTTGIKVQCYDGAGFSLTVNQYEGWSNVRSLKTILAHRKGTQSAYNINAPDGSGAPWLSWSSLNADIGTSDGPFRLIVPQTGTEGPLSTNPFYYSPAGTGTAANWNLAAKQVAAIEVFPLPDGVSELTSGELEDYYEAEEIAVYGNIVSN